ncbi:MAG: carboxylating nicotinate-nucleotide diphosphorylase [Candidatus Omnitrophota bacterium]
MNYAENLRIRNIIKIALAEDIGRGDITAELLVPRGGKVSADILAGEKGIVCGIDIAGMVFKSLDKSIKFIPKVKDGDRIKKGMVLAKLSGKASSILMGERVALNFLGMLSGIATRAGEFVDKIKNYKVKLMDTRKTLPGLRELQKYAVKTGGGYNHRFRLDEMVLIKDNHLRVTGFGLRARELKDLIKGIRKRIPPGMKIEIEVRNQEEFKHALEAKPDIIMLDNMRIDKIKKAVIMRNEENPMPKIEASGNIELKNISEYAHSGVDFISLGTLTKDVHSLDLSLEIE